MIKRLQITSPIATNLMTTCPAAPDFGGSKTPDDLPEDSAASIANSMKEVARDMAGVDISVTREMLPSQTVNVSNFVVTLPPTLTQEQRAEIDYWLREVCGNIRYAGE